MDITQLSRAAAGATAAVILAFAVGLITDNALIGLVAGATLIGPGTYLGLRTSAPAADDRRVTGRYIASARTLACRGASDD